MQPLLTTLFATSLVLAAAARAPAQKLVSVQLSKTTVLGGEELTAKLTFDKVGKTDPSIAGVEPALIAEIKLASSSPNKKTKTYRIATKKVNHSRRAKIQFKEGGVTKTARFEVRALPQVELEFLQARRKSLRLAQKANSRKQRRLAEDLEQLGKQITKIRASLKKNAAAIAKLEAQIAASKKK